MVATSIVRRDLLRFVRNPGRTALLFALPLVLAAMFTLVFGAGGVEDITIRVLVWDEDDSLISRLIEGAGGSSQADQRLDLVPVGEEGYEMMDNGEASAMVHLPAGFTRALLDGEATVVEVVKNPAERFLPQVVEEGVSLGAAVLSTGSRVFRPELDQLSQLVDSDAHPEDAVVATLSTSVNRRMRDLETYLFPPVVSLDTVTVDPETGTGSDRTVSILSAVLPGLALMGIFFVAQATTRDIVRERESGLLRQLLTAPVSTNAYLLGKSLSVLVVTCLGFALLVTVGIAAGMDWGDPFAAVALVIASALAAGGTLLLLMSVVGSERQGDALTTIVIIVWSLLGGAFVPLSQMPSFLEPLSRSTLVYWSVAGFNRLIFEDAGLADIALNLVVLFGCGGAFLVLGSWLLGRKIAAGGV
jgi:ABC-2 type transport system permease protein